MKNKHIKIITCAGCLGLLLIVCFFGIRLREAEHTHGTDASVSKRTTQKQERGGKKDFWYYCYYVDEVYCYEGWIFGGDLEN